MKAKMACVAVITLTWNEISSGDKHLHIHQELHAQNTTNKPAIVSSPERFYRYVVPGARYLSECFSTREVLMKTAKSRGHSDIVVEPVNREGRPVAASRLSMTNPELLYRGIII
jgi:hypothetical protein